MDEILNKLVESDLLNEDTKASLVEAFNEQISEAVTLAKAEATAEVREQLSEQFVAEKALLVEALESKNDDFLKEHLSELLSDFESFRDLEAEYATKLVEARQELAESVQKDMAQLIQDLDEYNTQFMQESFEELSESIEEVKKNMLGMKIYEAFAQTYQDTFVDSNDTLNALREAEEKLEETKKQLESTNQKLDESVRESKLQAVLANLHGRPREVMEQILSTTPTDKLDEHYEKFIGRVLNEGSKEKESEKSPVLAEDKSLDKTVEITGDVVPVNESTGNKKEKVLSEEVEKRLRTMAGLTV